MEFNPLYGTKKAVKLNTTNEPEAKTEPVSLTKETAVSGVAAFPAKQQVKQSIRETLKPASVRTKISFWLLWPLCAINSVLGIAGTVYALFEPSHISIAVQACIIGAVVWLIAVPLTKDAVRRLEKYRQNMVGRLLLIGSVGLMGLIAISLITNLANEAMTSGQRNQQQVATAKPIAAFTQLGKQASTNQALIAKLCKTDQGYAQQSKDFVAKKQTSWRAEPGSEGDLAAFVAALDSKASLIIASCQRKD